MWRTAQAEGCCSVRDLAGAPVAEMLPMRRFSWRPGQRHRPGLQFMVATGRLLLALDFVGGVEEVLSQPFRLRFITAEGAAEHTPDFLVLTPGAGWLLDVRPAELVGPGDMVRFAAMARAAAAVGWRYAVVAGWRHQVMAGVEALSARRRAMSDPLGLQAVMLDVVARAPGPLRQVVEGTGVAAVARPHLVHLLWHRRLSVDLAEPLGDGSWIFAVPRS
ncbi:TnsA-like heteromeric transposase endonuclease subunit [Spirillospora sp. CA-253888]